MQEKPGDSTSCTRTSSENLQENTTQEKQVNRPIFLVYHFLVSASYSCDTPCVVLRYSYYAFYKPLAITQIVKEQLAGTTDTCEMQRLWTTAVCWGWQLEDTIWYDCYYHWWVCAGSVATTVAIHNAVCFIPTLLDSLQLRVFWAGHFDLLTFMGRPQFRLLMQWKRIQHSEYQSSWGSMTHFAALLLLLMRTYHFPQENFP